MEAVLRHLVTLSVLMSVTWCGSRDGRHYHYHVRRRSRHVHPQTTVRVPGNFRVTSTMDSSRQFIEILPPQTMSGRYIANRFYATQNRNPSLESRHSSLRNGRFFQQGPGQSTQNSYHYQNLPRLNNAYRGNGLGLSVMPRILQERPKVVLNDQPQVDVDPYPSPEPNPSYLDPANFKLQDMDLKQMQATVDLIDIHTRDKEKDPAIYTGSRVLVLLLREQCFRLRRSGDPDIEIFCRQFNNRFRSFLF